MWSDILTPIMAFYSAPMAQVRINGTLPETFCIYNGTCLGCPQLHVLVMEHFANNSVWGFTVNLTTYERFLYADDLLLYSSCSPLHIGSVP